MTWRYCGQMGCTETRHHWSHMPCRDPEPHPPHTWSGEYTLYGPYRCEGR